MAIRNTSRRRLLHLLKIFYERTGDNNALTLPEIMSLLQANGIDADRRSLYEDIEELQAFGIDILRDPLGKRGYFLASRLFELPELWMIADAMRSSRFLTPKKTDQIISKLMRLAENAQRHTLSRQIYQTAIEKGENNSIYYLIDRIHQAIHDNLKVTFNVYRMNRLKRREFLNELKPYIVSPCMLIWDENEYFLVARLPDAGFQHFRVARMESLQILDEYCDEMGPDPALYAYARHTFGMEAGNVEQVVLLCDAETADTLFDRFGIDIPVGPEQNGRFQAVVNTSLQPGFFAWIFALQGRIQILTPAHARMKMFEMLEQLRADYRA